MAQQIEVDDAASWAENGDGDSALGSDSASETQSTNSSVYRNVDQFGRSYHKDGKWHAPIDANEQERMDILHHALKVLFDDRLLYFGDKLGKDPKRVLDVGTGTGIWAIELADAYPNADIVGIDQSPIQPTWVPPNCEFLIHNAEEPWDFRNAFDLIHFRCMEGAFSDWVKVYREASDSLSPGGSVHVVSQDLWTYRDNGDVPESIKSWMTDWNALMETIGHPTRISKKHAEWLREAGFVDVEEVELLVPLGWWAKDPKLKKAGAYYLASVLEGIESYSLKPLVDSGWKVEEVGILRANVDKAYRDMSLHLYSKVVVVMGRKPESGA